MDPKDVFAVFGMAFTLVVLVLITIVIVVVIWQSFATRRARMSVEREEAYRRLAGQATAAEQKSADEQQKAAKTMEEISHRLAAIEKILRDVE